MSEWKKARKKPIIIHFREVKGEVEEIPTREGTLKAWRDKDLIIEDIEGEVYPISKEIFAKTYDVIE